MLKLIKQTLTANQQVKISKALKFIQLITETGEKQRLRVIIAGGYAVDGFFGEITRYHDDIDIQIYGKERDALKVINDFLQKVGRDNKGFRNFLIEDKGRKEYYHNIIARYSDFVADIYYLQTLNNPFNVTKVIIKNDKRLSDLQTYTTQTGYLNNISYEIQDPLTEVVDKIYKREYKGYPKQEKHHQDIKNLKHNLSEVDIQKKLKEMINH